MIEKLLKDPFVFETKAYGRIVIINHEDTPIEVKADDKHGFEQTTNTLDLSEYLGKFKNKFKLRAMHDVNGKLYSICKYTFLNFPDCKEESVRNDYFYLPSIAKKYYATQVGTLAVRLCRFLIWANTNHKRPYILLEVAPAGGSLGYKMCSAQTGSEIVFNTDMILKTSEYIKIYENFCNSGKTYGLMLIGNPLKSLSSFVLTDLIEEEEFNYLKQYDSDLNERCSCLV